jgi:hypothetical protein
MKRKLTMALTGMALLFCIRGQSQSITPSILNAAGGNYYNPGMYTQFEWSFGELTLTDTYTASGGNLILTNGLLQPCTDMATRSPEILLFGTNEYKIFPNVTTGPFELDFFLNIPGQMDLQLTNALGQVLNKRSFEYHCCDRIERYDISSFPNGVYFINARFTPLHDGLEDFRRIRRESTFRVVKGGN